MEFFNYKYLYFLTRTTHCHVSFNDQEHHHPIQTRLIIILSRVSDKIKFNYSHRSLVLVTIIHVFTKKKDQIFMVHMLHIILINLIM